MKMTYYGRHCEGWHEYPPVAEIYHKAKSEKDMDRFDEIVLLFEKLSGYHNYFIGGDGIDNSKFYFYDIEDKDEFMDLMFWWKKAKEQYRKSKECTTR